MDALYASVQPYPIYEHSQWSEEIKSGFVGDENDPCVDEKALDSAHSTNPPSRTNTRRPSMLKTEDEFSNVRQVWHDRSHEPHSQMRHFSQPHVHMMNSNSQPFLRINESNFTNTMHHPHHWAVPHSGASTPTPIYGQIDSFGQPVNFAAPAPGFSAYTQDPTSAISMSPQSSQGGWASATSSDGPEQRGLISSPTFRAASPTSVMRPDGIRKKNARFEIPKERNLANIDAMILASTDENEKKELKQQKRLLRNRQAALDSRQRKKTHTEKLEQEKKVSEKKMYEMEEAVARMENTVTLERDQWMQQRLNLENIIHKLQYERDEAIRTNTLETAELRRQNNILKDIVRDLEGQQVKSYTSASDMNNYSTHLDEYDIEDSWDDEFGLMTGDDLKMEESESLRQTTPKPLASTVKVSEAKANTDFSWNAFYMCVLFGAFIAANGGTNTSPSALASSIPPAEADLVLKAVLNKGPEMAHELIPTQSRTPETSIATELSNSHAVQSKLTDMSDPASSLDDLHQTLSTPSRHQEMAAAFSLSASSYNHLTDPFNEHIHDIDDELIESPKPPPLQQAFAEMQAHKDNMEKITGIGSKIRERSHLWDRVPAQVTRDFEELVRSNSMNTNTNSNMESMQQ